MKIIRDAVLATVLAILAGRLIQTQAPFDLLEHLKSITAFLHVYAAIYGTILAFLIFVVWGQFTAAEAGLAREARALQELAGLCSAGRRDGCEEVLEAIRGYAKIASDSEWKALGEGKMLAIADQAFLHVQTTVLRSSANTEAEELTRATIIRVAERAAALRSERLAASVTRIPPTLWKTLMFSTGLLCLAVGAVGVHDRLVNMLLVGGVTSMVSLVLGVIADMDNPFSGVFNASREPMEHLRHI